MTRFEITLSNGEKILAEHAAETTQELTAALDGKAFVSFSEVKVGTAGIREILVATAQIGLIRPLGDDRMQGSAFRPKR